MGTCFSTSAAMILSAQSWATQLLCKRQRRMLIGILRWLECSSTLKSLLPCWKTNCRHSSREQGSGTKTQIKEQGTKTRLRRLISVEVHAALKSRLGPEYE